MRLDRAQVVAEEVREALSPGCLVIEVAGRIRRKKPDVKDVEIAYVPRMGQRQVGLWEYEPYSLVDGVLHGMVKEGVLRWDEVVKRNGPKYKRLIHCGSALVVELFAAQEQNWGLVLAIRTGPADFNKLLVMKEWGGGAMPLGMRMDGGWLWNAGGRVKTPTEEEFFAEIRVPCWPPEERTIERLAGWLSVRIAEAQAGLRWLDANAALRRRG